MLGFQAGCCEFLTQVVDIVRVVELSSGNVDGDRKWHLSTHVRSVPLGGLMDRLHQHLMAEFGNESGIFCHIDEMTGHEERAVVVSDSDQCFRSGESAGLGLEDRLIVHDERIFEDRSS